MNLKNLEGKTQAEQKSMYEVELIADFEMEYGNPDYWDDNVTAQFDKEWNDIQEKFSELSSRLIL